MPDLRTAIKDAMKASKASVNYSKGNVKEHCGNCEHYERSHSCDKVQGVIQPDYWCDLWTQR